MAKTIIVYFDGDCALCHFFVGFVLKRDRKRLFKYTSLQGNYAKEHLVSALRESFDSVVVTVDDTFYIKSKAVFFIFSLLSFPWPLLSLCRFLPRFITDWCYDLVAVNRKKFFPGKSVCPMPKPSERQLFLD